MGRITLANDTETAATTGPRQHYDNPTLPQSAETQSLQALRTGEDAYHRLGWSDGITRWECRLPPLELGVWAVSRASLAGSALCPLPGRWIG
jgi:hypothetical protein